MLKKFLFADLDDTLFQSRRKCLDRDDLTPVAYLKDGSAHSFATPAQDSLFALFQREMAVIPVTARNADAFQRVRLDFRHGAVVNYGGIILRADGQPETGWLDRSAAMAAASHEELSSVACTITSAAAAAGAAVRVRIIEDFGVPFYVCAKSEEGDEKVLDHLEPLVRCHCAEKSLPVAVHRNGNNLSVLPEWLDKRHAVEHLANRLRAEHGEIVTIGMGDSLSDIAFMRACDYALVPNPSQINRLMGAA